LVLVVGFRFNVYDLGRCGFGCRWCGGEGRGLLISKDRPRKFEGGDCDGDRNLERSYGLRGDDDILLLSGGGINFNNGRPRKFEGGDCDGDRTRERVLLLLGGGINFNNGGCGIDTGDSFFLFAKESL